MTLLVGRFLVSAGALIILCVTVAAAEKPGDRRAIDSGERPAVVDSVRFFPVPGREQSMVGGKFEGSNVSPFEGFQVLAVVEAEPKADQWTELHFKNDRPYRWVRYEARGNSHGNDAKIEFSSGARRLDGRRYQDSVDGRFIGVDLGELSSTSRVNFSPGSGRLDEPREITLSTRSAGASIRYCLDGTTPGPNGGTLYTGPIRVSGLTTITAVAFKERLAPSPVTDATYFVAAPPVALNTFHVGNSLTGNAVRFPLFARSAGIENRSSSFLIGGAYTVRLWKARESGDKDRFAKEYARARFPLEHFTLQPRDFNIDEEVDYERKFIDFVREKSPDVQPWLYAEWVEKDRRRPSDKGLVPSYQMKKVFPAETWEESMSAMLLYVEEVQHRLNSRDKEGKRARILPCSLALGWARNLIDNNQFPGLSPGEASFYRTFFEDDVHVNPNGCYLVDAVWYAAFMHESPEGKFLPVGTTLTAAQARVIQQLAWQIVLNYPDCGLTVDGDICAAPPQFSPTPEPISKPTPVHLTSAPGFSYRYTLDGTVPTRTRGYVYCGVITARPGMTIKAVEFASGIGTSRVAEASYPEVPAK
jgi:hypothetical protein